MAVGDKIYASAYYGRSAGDFIVSQDSVSSLNGKVKASGSVIADSDVRRKGMYPWSSLTDRKIETNGRTASITNPSGEYICSTLKGYKARTSATLPYINGFRGPYFITGSLYAPQSQSYSGIFDFGFFTYSQLPHYGTPNTTLSIEFNSHSSKIYAICKVNGTSVISEQIGTTTYTGVYNVGVGYTVSSISSSSITISKFIVYVNNTEKNYSINLSTSEKLGAGFNHYDSSDNGSQISYTLQDFSYYYNTQAV